MTETSYQAVDQVVHQLENGKWVVAVHDWEKGQWYSPVSESVKAKTNCSSYFASTLAHLGADTYATRSAAIKAAKRHGYLPPD